jgi:hypothetical protein
MHTMTGHRWILGNCTQVTHSTQPEPIELLNAWETLRAQVHIATEKVLKDPKAAAERLHKLEITGYIAYTEAQLDIPTII